MTILLGLTLLMSLAAIGRDGQVLPFHGICAAAAISSTGHGTPAFVTLVLLAVLNGAGWMILRRYVPWRTGDLQERRLVQQASGVAICGAVLLTLLTALAATPGLPVLICISMVLSGLCATALSVPLLQLVGLLCSLNGLLLLGGLSQSWPLILGGSLVWIGLITISYMLLPRLAWLRVEIGDNG